MLLWSQQQRNNKLDPLAEISQVFEKLKRLEINNWLISNCCISTHSWFFSLLWEKMLMQQEDNVGHMVSPTNCLFIAIKNIFACQALYFFFFLNHTLILPGSWGPCRFLAAHLEFVPTFFFFNVCCQGYLSLWICAGFPIADSSFCLMLVNSDMSTHRNVIVRTYSGGNWTVPSSTFLRSTPRQSLVVTGVQRPFPIGLACILPFEVWELTSVHLILLGLSVWTAPP